MRNVSEKLVEKIKTPSLFSVSPQITIWPMRHAMEIPKSPNTLSRNM